MNFNLQKLRRKKRAVSPVIAAILLIGLAVLAGAAIFGVVLPMLNSGTSASDVTVSWSGTGTATRDSSAQTLTFFVTVSNGGTATVTGNVSAVYHTTATAGNQADGGVTTTVGSSTGDFEIAAGKTVTVQIVATYSTNTFPTTGKDIIVSFDFGTFNFDKTFSAKT